MRKLALVTGTIVCYIVAAYVSEFVFYRILISADPLYGATSDSSPDWSLFPWAPLAIPFRYLFVAYSTVAGGRESLMQKQYAVPCATFMVTFLGSYSAFYFLVLLIKRK
jgi:hypothetical protein